MSDELLTSRLYRAEQVRQLDRIAIQEFGIPGFTLMRRAGKGCMRATAQKYPHAKRLVVCCGRGNNGGDGYIIAGAAKQRGMDVVVVQRGDTSQFSADARRAEEWALRRAITVSSDFPGNINPETDVVVDALLGTGLSGPVRDEDAKLIQQINGSGAPVVAVDIPSGLSADTGMPMGVAVRARLTMTFIGLKQGLFTGEGPDHTGAVVLNGLKVPAEVHTRLNCAARRIQFDQFGDFLAPRARGAHKGAFGQVLVIGGDYGMPGAVIMAAEAAARTGAGLVRVATRPEHVPAVAGRRPECMVHGLRAGADLGPLLEQASVLVVGPGLGRSAWSTQIFQQVADCELPMLLDADALNLIAEQKVVSEWTRERCILTPHPGEAARLLGCSIPEVQADRFAAAQALQARYQGVVLLKGRGTLVTGGSSDFEFDLCDLGNPGMAAGGMGDALSGVIGGLLAQGLPERAAASAGAWLHASSADRAASARGERGMLATDLFDYLPALVNP